MTRAGFEPTIPAWKAGVLTTWLTGHIKLIKAGNENRTRDNSLEGCGFTTELYPHISDEYYTIKLSYKKQYFFQKKFILFQKLINGCFSTACYKVKIKFWLQKNS